MKPETLRLAIMGLSLSHPYAFADYLKEQGHRVAAVWDYDEERARSFAEQHGAAVAHSPEATLSADLDGVIVTSMTSDHAKHAGLALRAGLPTYVDKLLCLDPAEAEALVQSGPVVMAGSALRFLPDFRAMVKRVQDGECGLPLTAAATVYHGMQTYLQPAHSWQDNPAQSGGVLMNMGIHAVDLLIAALGPDWSVVAADRSRRVHASVQSEDQAVILLRGAGGELATIQVVSGTERHYYALKITGTHEDGLWQLPDPERPVGAIYAPLIDAFLDAIRTRRWPVPAAELVAAVRILAAARSATLL